MDPLELRRKSSYTSWGPDDIVDENARPLDSAIAHRQECLCFAPFVGWWETGCAVWILEWMNEHSSVPGTEPSTNP